MNTNRHPSIEIHPTTLLPDLLRSAPQVRPVLDRYGLRGCGGPLGPVETLEFFAHAHDVPLPRLMEELREAMSRTAQPAVPTSIADTIADSIYRPFFKSGIAIALTLGAVWGAYLLLRIGFLRSFTAVGINEVNAHGHAQIFGWVGLFVMGFAYQAFPRFKHTSLAYPRLALATLWIMLAGIVTRSSAQAFLDASPILGSVGLAGSIAEIVAILLFAGIIGTTLSRSGKPLAVYDYYIAVAMGWFVLQAVYGTAYFWALAVARDRDAMLGLVATWQAPLRDVQIHGFMMLMILGVSQRIFPNFYGFAAPGPRRSLVALYLLNAAIIGEVAGLILMRTKGHTWAALWYGSVLLLAVGVALLVSGWRLHSAPRETDRSLKFLRAAYVWLFISLTMLVLLPAHQFGALRLWAPESHAAQIGFSHAYYGAIRHAITVGFVSMMIVGVAAKVVPTLNGIDIRQLPSLWIPFVLLNTGCAMRVGFQALTDFRESVFPIAGFSGILEVAGLTIWGVHLWRTMNGRLRVPERGADSAILPKGRELIASDNVGAALDAYPELLPTFLEYGFTPLANPLMRRTIARTISIEGAARRFGIEPERLLKSLNAARARSENDPSPFVDEVGKHGASAV